MTQPSDGVRAQSFETTIRKMDEGHSYTRSFKDVEREFDQLDPGAISDACRVWARAASELNTLAEGLKNQAAHPLNEAWSSPSSPQAQQQLQLAEATARALSNDCMQMARATDYAAQYAEWYKSHLPSEGDAMAAGVGGMAKGKGLGGAAQMGLEHMTGLLGRYNEVVGILPNSVQAQLATASDKSDFHLDQTQAPGIGGAGGAAGLGGHGMGGVGSSSALSGGHSAALGYTGGVPGMGGHGLGGSAGGHGVGGTVGGHGLGGSVGGHGVGGSFGASPADGTAGLDPYAAHSSLAGDGLGGRVASFDPTGLSSGLSGGGVGGLGAGLGAGGVGAAGLGAGGIGATGLGAGRAGGGIPGGSAGAGIAGLAGLTGEETGAAGGAGAGRGGAGMSPMGGHGGQGEGEEERERSTWLMEDDDVWGVGGDVPPPVISG